MAKPRGYWNDYDNCFQEALKFSSRTEFARKSPGCYEKAHVHGWIDDYDWMPKYEAKPSGYWNDYKKCYEAASTCLTRTEYSKNYSTAYKTSSKNGWLKDYYWFKDGVEICTEKRTVYTEEKCREIALGFKTKKEFREYNESCYKRAARFGWLDNYTWLKDERFDIFQDKIDLVYAYEFVDFKTVYVGRTLIKRIKKRDREHLFKNDSVSSFAKQHDIPVPEIKILENELTVKDGAKREGEWIEKYKEDGWCLLNKAKAGSIGGLGKGKSRYNQELCRKLASECTHRADFNAKHTQAYRVALRNGWLDDYTWFVDGRDVASENRRVYDYQECYQRAKQYSTITEFEENDKGACAAARRNGWMNDYTWFTRLWERKWNKQSCYYEAQKFQTLAEFSSESSSAYSTACHNGWIDDYTWLKRKRVKSGTWQVYENCYNEALNYKSRAELENKSPGCYEGARKHGWLDDYEWFERKTPKK